MSEMERILERSRPAQPSDDRRSAPAGIPDLALDELLAILSAGSGDDETSGAAGLDPSGRLESALALLHEPAVRFRLHRLERLAWRIRVGSSASARWLAHARPVVRRAFTVAIDGSVDRTPPGARRVGGARVRTRAATAMLPCIPLDVQRPEAWRLWPIGSVLVDGGRRPSPRIGRLRLRAPGRVATMGGGPVS